MTPPTTDLSDRVTAAITNPSVRARHIGLARGIVGEADAEDVVQTSYMKAYRNKHKFSGDSSPETWLHKIVFNTALNLKRKKSRYSCSHHYRSNNFQSHNPGPDVICAARDELTRVCERMTETASPIAQEGIRMAICSDIFGDSYGDLSREYGVPEGTIGWRMSDSRRQARSIRDKLCRISLRY